MGAYVIGPSRPKLLSPADGTQGVEYQPTDFSWTTEYAPGGYVFHVVYTDTNQDAIPPTPTMTAHASVTLPADREFRWYVVAPGVNGAKDVQSYYATFKTKANPQCNVISSAPVSVIPGGEGWANSSEYICYTQAPGYTGIPTYRFQWQTVPGATSYQVNVYWFGDGSTVLSQVYSADQVPNGITPPMPLKENYGYGWEVRAKNACMTSYGPASPLRYFTCTFCSGSCGGYPVAPH
jgi:hypothetical protein